MIRDVRLLQIVPADYETLGVRTMLVITILFLCGVIAYLYKSKEAALKNKDIMFLELVKKLQEDIKEATKDHQSDLKAATMDLQTMLDKYHQFMQNIKEIITTNNGRN